MAWYSILPWIVAQANPAPVEGGDDETSIVLKLLATVGILAGSLVLGGVIARALRLPDFSFRIGLVLLTAIAGIVITLVAWPPKLGIDLSGGVVLVYEVDTALTKPSWMPTAIAQLNDELNTPGGPRIQARAGTHGQIEIVAPAGTDPEHIESAVLALRNTADLTLHRVGQGSEKEATVFIYAADEAHKAVEMNNLIAAVSRRINPGGVKELTIRQYGADQLEVIIPEVETSEVEQIKKKISTSGLLEFRICANENDDRDIIRAAERTPGADVYLGGKLVGRWVKAGPDLSLPAGSLTAFRESESRGREVLVRLDLLNVDGGYLDRAARGFDEGNFAVDFSFDTEGSEKFGQLTRANLPDSATGFYRHLGIVLDDVMISAPTIEETIRGRGQIKGRFTEQEVDFLVEVLNAGSLPATLSPQPISEQLISAQLGEDTIRKGTMAMLISTAAVLIFMAVYYAFCGVVADITVVLNVLFVVALMMLIKAAFTLPGLAGLVLSMAMAVDANVLIFERMREEDERGASLRMIIRNGYSRAMSAIVDGNVTTIVTAVVLYAIGTDQIKGFGVTLTLGLLINLFTAVYVSRVIFDIFERKRWMTKLRMMRFVGETHFNFKRWRTAVIAGSTLLIVAGLVAAGIRGRGLLDIDFTGGSSVNMLFAEGKGHDIAQVRAAVESLPDVAVSTVGESNLQYKIDSSEGDINKVEDVLKKEFGDSLQSYSMTIGALSTIEAPKPDVPAEPAKTEGAPTTPAATPAAEPKAEPKAGEPKAAEPKAGESKDAPPAPEKSEAESPPPPGDTPKSDEKPADSPPDSSTNRARFPGFGVTSLATELQTALFMFGQVAAEQPADAAKAAEKSAEQPAPSAPEEPAKESKSDAAAPADAAKAEPAPAAADRSEPAKTEPDKAAPDNTSPELTVQPAANEAGPPSDSPLVGGTRVELSFPQLITHDTLAEKIDAQLDAIGKKTTYYELSNPEYKSGSEAAYAKWTLEIALDQAQTRSLVETIQKQLAETPVFPSSNQIGGKVAGDTQIKALVAIVVSMIMIVIYIWIRFQNVAFGLAGVVALIHDVMVAIALLALSYYLAPYLGFLMIDPFKISLSVVAALLTIVGYSINDKIVIFDRIREVRGKSHELSEDLVNLSLNQTLSRTILTGGAVLISTLILFFVGGPGIHAFAFTMFVGVVAGTYSSVFVAPPILLWLTRSPAAAQKARAARGVGETSAARGA